MLEIHKSNDGNACKIFGILIPIFRHTIQKGEPNKADCG